MINQVVEVLRKLTAGDRRHVVAELAKPEEATGLSAAERRQLAQERVRLLQEFEPRNAELDREHAARLAAVEENKRAAHAAFDALCELQRNYREARDSIDAQLMATREPEVAAFLEELRQELAELPKLQRVFGYHITRRSGAMDFTQRLIDNGASVVRRREALTVALAKAERLPLEALDTAELVGRLAAIRDALPPVEDVEVLAKAAQRREQEAIDAA
jgi:hypothetical protein